MGSWLVHITSGLRSGPHIHVLTGRRSARAAKAKASDRFEIGLIAGGQHQPVLQCSRGNQRIR